jgi:putative glutamine amidotransferase
MRPVVALTCASEPDPRAGYFLRKTYLKAVEAAGALPMIVAPGKPEDAEAILDRVQGLFLTGGGDIDPDLYNARPACGSQAADRERDVFEIALVKTALVRDMPVLAVCRGMQVLSVACGGRLVQDIAAEIKDAADHRPAIERAMTAHDVELLPGTRIRSILGQDRMGVNSTHHQAVREPGEGLIVSARCPRDRIIEALESPRHRFVLGVQWHPEEVWGRQPSFAPLFAAWVKECSAR